MDASHRRRGPPDDEDTEVRHRRSSPAMHDRRDRMGLLGLTLAFPLLIVSVNPKGPSLRESALPLLAVEAAVVVGLSFAGQERFRLLAERRAPASPSPRRSAPAAPHAARPLRRAHAWRL